MRILFLHDPPDLYGASRSLLRLASRLTEDGHTVRVMLPQDGPLRPRLEASGIHVDIYPHLAVLTRRRFKRLGGALSLLLDLLRSVAELKRVTANFRPDLIHSNSAVVLPGGMIARLQGIPHVWHVREIFSDFPRLWVLYQWYMALFSDRIICVSHAVARQFDPRIQRRVCVLHNGFPAGEFPDVPPERVEQFRRNHNLNANLLVGLVGRIKIGRKGQDVLLGAASLLKTRFPDIRFLLIGSAFPGNEAHLAMLRSLIRQLDLEEQVTYTGDVEDIQAAYAALDISVQLSVMPEAFSGVVVESMAMGKPVVGSRCGGTIEQVDDGVTGFLVDPGDAKQLAAVLGRLLEDTGLRKQLGANGKEKFLECFEFEGFYRRLREVQSALLTKRSDSQRRKPNSTIGEVGSNIL